MRGVVWVVVRYGLALVLAVFAEVFFFFFYPLTYYGSLMLGKVLVGVQAVDGLFVVGGQRVELVPACVASGAYLLLAVLVLVTRGVSWRKGLGLFFVGGLLVLVLNVARITVLLWVLAEYGENLFGQVHLFFWKVLSTVFVVGVWVFLVVNFRIKGVPVVSDVRFLMRKAKV